MKKRICFLLAMLLLTSAMTACLPVDLWSHQPSSGTVITTGPKETVETTHCTVPHAVTTEPTLSPETSFPTENVVTEPTTVSPSDKEVFQQLSHLMPDYRDRYYISRLRGTLLQAFYAAYSAYYHYETYCSFPSPITVGEAFALIVYLDYDCPELLQYEDENVNRYFENGMVVGMEISYSRSRNEYERMHAQVQAALNELLAPCTSMSLLEAEQYVYEQIISSCTYSYSADFSYNPYGVLINRVARCEGFSRTFSWAMRRLGAECFVIVGDSIKGAVAHSWNVIKIDGNYYEVDLTMDNVRGEDSALFPICYGFFNVSDKLHRENYSLWAPCTLLGELPVRNDESLSPHTVHETYALSYDEAVHILFRQLDARTSTAYIKFDKTTDWERFRADTMLLIDNWSQQSGVGTSYRYYWYSDSFVMTFAVEYYPQPAVS